MRFRALILSQMDEDSYIIFDVREKDEFEVSHIENSIWVDPSIDASSFNAQLFCRRAVFPSCPKA